MTPSPLSEVPQLLVDQKFAEAVFSMAYAYKLFLLHDSAWRLANSEELRYLITLTTATPGFGEVAFNYDTSEPLVKQAHALAQQHFNERNQPQ